MTWHIAIEVPAKVGLPALHNARGWKGIARTVKTHKALYTAALATRDGELLPQPLDDARWYDVLLVRVSRHPLDWSAGDKYRSIGGDNTGSALKDLRDVTAGWLGCLDSKGRPNDRDPRVRWYVGQRWGPSKYVGVELWIATWQDCVCCGQSTLPAKFLRGEL